MMLDIYNAYTNSFNYDKYRFGENQAKVVYKTLHKDSYCHCCNAIVHKDTDKVLEFTSMLDGRTIEIICPECIKLMQSIVSKEGDCNGYKDAGLQDEQGKSLVTIG